MKIQTINPLEFTGWDDLVLTNEKHSFFHSSCWARVLYESYGYKPLYFAVTDDRTLTTLVPVMEVKSFLTGKRGVSLPFTDCCDPAIPKSNKSHAIWNFLKEYGERADWKYLEIRGGDGLGKMPQPSSWCYEHILDLRQGEQNIYSKFRHSTKRNIKKSQKSNMEVAVCDSLESMREFYRLNCLTRRRHGLPPQPYSFFENVHKYIIARKHGILVLARYKGRTIAANLYFHFGKKAIYKYGASEHKFQHLRPNNLVMWKAVEWYCQKGYENFSFGITDPAHSGLRQFKKGWGAEEKVINYYRYNFLTKDFIKTSSKVTGWHTNVFNKLPISVLKLFGAVLYRHIG